MDRPIRRSPSRGLLAVAALVAVVVVVAAILSFGNRPVAPESSSRTSPSPSSTSSGSATASPAATASSSPIPTDTPVGIAHWARVTAGTPGPSARSGHTWTVDPSSAVAYLFGGRGGSGDLADLWAYDLTSDRWTQLKPTGTPPSARSEHGAVWVDGLGLVIFGGRTASGVLDDFWAYDPEANAWRTLEVGSVHPSARAAACLTLRTDGRLWLYGGDRGSGPGDADLWIYDPGPSSWTRRAPKGGPGTRTGAACWWSSDDRLIVHGGAGDPGSAPVGDLWALDPAASSDGTWKQVDTTGLPARQRAAVAFTSHGGVVLGGAGKGDALLADVVVFAPESLSANVLGAAPDGPVARSGAALADDPEAERTLLFGGHSASGPLDDLWSLDLPS
jgi:galactose oxidase-like protein